MTNSTYLVCELISSHGYQNHRYVYIIVHFKRKFKLKANKNGQRPETIFFSRSNT